MADIVERHLIYFIYFFSVQLRQIFWYWIAGMAVGSAISVFGKEKIHEIFLSLRGKKLGVLGLIPASLLGIASPLCMYGTIPIAASFSEKGMEEDWLAAFMMSSILLNPQILFYSAALGMPMLVIRFTACFLCGIAAGAAVRFFFKKKQFFNFCGFFASSANRDIDANLLLRFLKNFGRNIKATSLFFIIGVALSALFQAYAPQDVFARFSLNNRGFGILMAAAIGVPLYACGGGTIPLLQSWLQYGMSMGSAAAFMITGPAAKITNLSALKIVLSFKNFLFYLLFAVLFALVCGFFVDFFNLCL